jgi:hypothetical protein
MTSCRELGELYNIFILINCYLPLPFSPSASVYFSITKKNKIDKMKKKRILLNEDDAHERGGFPMINSLLKSASATGVIIFSYSKQLILL